MQTHPKPTTATARALWGQPLLSAVSADFKKGTVTFATSAPIDPKVRYVMVAEPVALAAMGEDERTAQEGDVILPVPMELKARAFHVNGRQALEVENLQGGGITLYRAHTPDGLSDLTRPDWHPAHWSGTEYRHDTQGRRWNSRVGPHVTDDFGMLVPVPEHLE